MTVGEALDYLGASHERYKDYTLKVTIPEGWYPVAYRPTVVGDYIVPLNVSEYNKIVWKCGSSSYSHQPVLIVDREPISLDYGIES